MRMMFLAGLATISATAAMADNSIDRIESDSRTRSVEVISCQECGPLKREEAEVTEVTLEPGTQRIEIRKVDGEMKVFRTEAWMGGSPVTYVSKATPEIISESNTPNDVATTSVDADKTIVIDTSATTSALNADMGGMPEKTVHAPAADDPVIETRTRSFDANSFTLRLN